MCTCDEKTRCEAHLGLLLRDDADAAAARRERRQAGGQVAHVLTPPDDHNALGVLRRRLFRQQRVPSLA